VDIESSSLQLTYLERILDLCGLICYYLGDLDMLPFAKDMLSLLTSDNQDEQYLQKRGLIIDFLCSQIDDKQLRLDLKRREVSFIYDDFKQIASQTVSLFKSHLKPDVCLTLLTQDLKLIMKLLKYQIYLNKTEDENLIESIFGNDFNTKEFISEILTFNKDSERYHAKMVYLASQVLVAQQSADFQEAAGIFVE